MIARLIQIDNDRMKKFESVSRISGERGGEDAFQDAHSSASSISSTASSISSANNNKRVDSLGWLNHIVDWIAVSVASTEAFREGRRSKQEASLQRLRRHPLLGRFIV